MDFFINFSTKKHKITHFKSKGITMQLKLNGEQISTESSNILELLQEYKIQEKSVAVAVNMEIIKKDSWEKFCLTENDNIECLTFMGGG